VFSDIAVVPSVYTVETVLCRTGGRAVVEPIIIKCSNYLIKMFKQSFKMKISDFWDMAPCSLVEVDVSEVHKC
jgi:hypothetical protein